MSHPALLVLKAASSKQGRKVIGAVLVFLMGLLILFCIAMTALISSFAVLCRGNELYYPLINSNRIVEPYDPDRIIRHEYEVEIEKERPVLDENGVPKLDENGDIIMETYTETETRVEEIESPHMGADFEARAGSYVVASCGGTVTAMYSTETDGNVITIFHPEAHYSTRYMHLSSTLVAVGDEIVMGQPLGKVGTTGECTPYRETEEDVGRVHFEVLTENNEQIDPAPLLHRWGAYLDIPTMLVQEVAGSEWADWMVSEIADSDIVWNGEAYMWPVPGHTALSSDFGYRDLDHDGVLENFHSGIDIPAAAGTPIYAAAPGIVSTKAHWSYGICVKISVDGQTVNVYGHMSARAEGITDGVMVQAGDLIGYVGSTGNSSGNHLHFEVDVSGEATDPKPFFG